MMRTFSCYGLYPLLWLWTVVCLIWALQNPEQTTLIIALKGGITVAALLTFEWLTPLEQNWGMTKQHFLKRDLPMIIVNGLTIVSINYGLVLMAVSIATTAEGPIAGAHLIVQVIVGLLVFEILQYSVHRLMHMDETPLQRFLWRSHAIHHLPQQLYVIMHAVFHPINAVFVRVIVQLVPIWVLGFSADAVLIYGAIIALHGTVSHLNIDMRIGPLNYVFVGPELHRYHHSAKTAEAVNYGSALSIFDQMFGTFLYRPEKQPASLGLYEDSGYPGQHAFFDALIFPFRKDGLPQNNLMTGVPARQKLSDNP